MTTPAEGASQRPRSLLRRRARRAGDEARANAIDLREATPGTAEEAAASVDAAQPEAVDVAKGRGGKKPSKRVFRLSAAATALRRESRLVAALVLLAAGVVFVLLGWYGSAHTNILTEQIPYLISGGLLGLGLIVVAGVFAASAANERQARLLRSEIAAAITGFVQNGSPASNGTSAVDENAVFLLAGGHGYHVAGCPLLEGKDGVQRLSVADAQARGLAPCKLCGPD
jgi:hypothetical protein